MRSIGQGLQSSAKFCGVMNMPSPVKHNTYDMINGLILRACTKNAVLDEIKETETLPKTDIGRRNLDAERPQFTSWSLYRYRSQYRGNH